MWFFNADSGIVRFIWTHFSEGLQNIKITYTGGYSSIPDDVQQACCIWASLIYKRSPKWEMTAKAYTEYSDSYFIEAKPDIVQQTIDSYRLRTWSL